MKPYMTIRDGSCIFEVVSRPTCDNLDGVASYTAYAYCRGEIPDRQGLAKLYRVTWHPCEGWQDQPEQDRCKWQEPYRVKWVRGYYRPATGDVFVVK